MGKMIIPFKLLHPRNASFPMDYRDSGNDNTVCNDVVSDFVSEDDNDGSDEKGPKEFNC